MSRGRVHESMTIRDPPQEGGVKVMPKIFKTRQLTIGIMARRATRKTSVGKTRPTLVEPKPMDDKSHTMSVTRDDQEATGCSL